MEQEKIRELIDRYLDGKSTEEEELMLKKSLGNPALPEDLRKEYGWIAAPPPEIPEPTKGFFDRLEAVTRPEKEMKTPVSLLRLVAGTAAAAAIMTGVWLAFRYTSLSGTKDTYSDPEIAMAEVRSILMDVSEKMNSGTSHLEQVGTVARRPEELEGLTRVGDIVGRNLSRLRYLDELVPDIDETEKTK